MILIELQIPPAALLEIFETKSVATGMTHAVPGGATLTLGGMEEHAFGAMPLVPVIVTLESSIAIKPLTSWLSEKLKGVHVRHIRIKGMEIEATAGEIARAVLEAIEIERELTVSDDPGAEKPSMQKMAPAAIPDAEIIFSKEAVICLRLPPGAGMEEYVQGSAIRKCSVCQSDVLVAPSTQMILAEEENEIVCMECWTEAHPPEMTPEEKAHKLVSLMEHMFAGEQAYDDMYEAHSLREAAVYYSEAKEYFYTAIGLARELKREQDADQLENRLAHIKSVFRSQFSN